MPFSDPTPALSLLDQELLAGASYGSDVTVEEIVVTASAGGGYEVRVDRDDYYYFTGESPEGGQFESWADAFAAEVDSFASSHVFGDPSATGYQQALDAMKSIYATAKLNARPNEYPIDAPNGHTLTMTELLQSIKNIQIFIGPHSQPQFDAYTDVNGPVSKIYIDPNKLSDDIAGFGLEKGVNYTLYHELGHAVIDGETDSSNANKEQIANEYGQVLAEQVGASYPTDQELTAQAGGTVPR